MHYKGHARGRGCNDWCSHCTGFDINRALYKYETLGVADHLSDSVEIYLDIYNLFLMLLQLTSALEDRNR